MVQHGQRRRRVSGADGWGQQPTAAPDAWAVALAVALLVALAL